MSQLILPQLILPDHFKKYESCIRLINNNLMDQGFEDRLFVNFKSCFIFAEDYFNNIDCLDLQESTDNMNSRKKSSRNLTLSDKSFMVDTKNNIDLVSRRNNIISGINYIKTKIDVLMNNSDTEKQDNESNSELKICYKELDKIQQEYATNENPKRLTNVARHRSNPTKNSFIHNYDFYETKNGEVLKNGDIANKEDIVSFLSGIPLSHLEKTLLLEFPLERLQLVRAMGKLVILRFLDNHIDVYKSQLMKYSPVYYESESQFLDIPLKCSASVAIFLKHILNGGLINNITLTKIDDLNNLVGIINYLGIKIGQ